MKIKFVIPFFLISLVWANYAFSSLIIAKGNFVLRQTGSANYLYKRGLAESRGYNWTLFQSELTKTVNRIYNIPSNFSLGATLVSDATSFSDGNNIDEIYFGDLGSGGTLAITLSHYTCHYNYIAQAYDSCNLTEGDIILQQPANFFNLDTSASIYSVTDNRPQLSEVLSHEFGHGMGLDHDGNFQSMMGGPGCGSYYNGLHSEAYPGEAMTSQLTSYYGYWSGATPDYSVTGISWSSSYTAAGQLPYALCLQRPSQNLTASRGTITSLQYLNAALPRVQRGDTVRVYFTVNNTIANSALPWQIYMSENNTITTTDIPVQYGSLNLTFGGSTLYYFDVIIPAGISNGTRYVGLYLDPSSTLTEFSKFNNASWVPVYVQ